MPRFFVAGASAARGSVFITGRDAEHVGVLRMRPGDRLVVCDGEGTDLDCRIRSIGADGVEAEIIKSGPSEAEPSVDCTVFAGFAKGDRVDYLVQKCTEAGAASVTFFLCERCVARPEGKAVGKKLERLRRIAEEAAKQSGRGRVPAVGFLPDFSSVLDLAKGAGLGLFMYETGERTPIRQVLERAGNIKSCAIITGPEGGFEPWEAEAARRSGLQCVSMGPRILRCETAPMVALTAVMYETGNL